MRLDVLCQDGLNCRSRNKGSLRRLWPVSRESMPQLERALARIGEAVRTSLPSVTSAVPLTTTQCSERWKCFCNESLLPGFTTMRKPRGVNAADRNID